MKRSIQKIMTLVLVGLFIQTNLWSNDSSGYTETADSITVSDKLYELTIYVIPSPEWLGWDSPAELMKNTAKHKILPLASKKKKRAIGHVFVELTDGDYRFFGGMTAGASARQADKVINKGYNLGILFSEIEGRLDDPVALENELQERYRDGDVAFMRFQLHPENFDRLRTYIEEYQERNYHHIYNGKNLPRHGQGAGCSAFGISFIEVAGLLKEEWKEEWTVSVPVPERLIGGPATGKYVSPLTLLRADSWAEGNEPAKMLELYEPYLIYQWIREQWLHPEPVLADRISYIVRQEAVGINLNYTNVSAPVEPIFLSE